MLNCILPFFKKRKKRIFEANDDRDRECHPRRCYSIRLVFYKERESLLARHVVRLTAIHSEQCNRDKIPRRRQHLFVLPVLIGANDKIL